MRSILFVTGNERKVEQANACLGHYNTNVVAKDLDLHEIQSHDPEEIVRHKARSAYENVAEPVVVCDHFWAFHALNGWPGGYMKDMNHWFNEHDFLRLMEGQTDRSVTLTESIVYDDGKNQQIFNSDFPGVVALKPAGKGRVSCERIVIFEGQSKTIAQQIDEEKMSREMRKSAWHKLGKWLQDGTSD